jgi:hypothetical protein
VPILSICQQHFLGSDLLQITKPGLYFLIVRKLLCTVSEKIDTLGDALLKNLFLAGFPERRLGTALTVPFESKLPAGSSRKEKESSEVRFL